MGTTTVDRVCIEPACAPWTAPATTARHAIPPSPDPEPIIGVVQLTIDDVQLDHDTPDIASQCLSHADLNRLVLRLRWPEQLRDAPTLPLPHKTVQRASVPVAARTTEALQRYLTRARLLLLTIEDRHGVCHAYCTLDIRHLLRTPLRGVWPLRSCPDRSYSLGHIRLQLACALETPPSVPTATELAARAHNDKALAALRHARQHARICTPPNHKEATHSSGTNGDALLAAQLSRPNVGNAPEPTRSLQGGHQGQQQGHASGHAAVQSATGNPPPTAQPTTATLTDAAVRPSHHAAQPSTQAVAEGATGRAPDSAPHSDAAANTVPAAVPPELLPVSQAVLRGMLALKHACAQAAAAGSLGGMVGPPPGGAPSVAALPVEAMQETMLRVLPSAPPAACSALLELAARSSNTVTADDVAAAAKQVVVQQLGEAEPAAQPVKAVASSANNTAGSKRAAILVQARMLKQRLAEALAAPDPAPAPAPKPAPGSVMQEVLVDNWQPQQQQPRGNHQQLQPIAEPSGLALSPAAKAAVNKLTRRVILHNLPENSHPLHHSYIRTHGTINSTTDKENSPPASKTPQPDTTTDAPNMPSPLACAAAPAAFLVVDVCIQTAPAGPLTIHVPRADGTAPAPVVWPGKAPLPRGAQSPPTPPCAVLVPCTASAEQIGGGTGGAPLGALPLPDHPPARLHVLEVRGGSEPNAVLLGIVRLAAGVPCGGQQCCDVVDVLRGRAVGRMRLTPLCGTHAAQRVGRVDTYAEHAADDGHPIVLHVDGLPVNMPPHDGCLAVGRFARLGSDANGWHTGPLQPIMGSAPLRLSMQVPCEVLVAAAAGPAVACIELWTVWECTRSSQHHGQHDGQQHGGQGCVDQRPATTQTRCGIAPMHLTGLQQHEKREPGPLILPLVLDPHSVEFSTTPPGRVCTLTLALPAAVLHGARMAASVWGEDHHEEAAAVGVDHQDEISEAQSPRGAVTEAGVQSPRLRPGQGGDDHAVTVVCVTDVGTTMTSPPPSPEDMLPATVNADICIEVEAACGLAAGVQASAAWLGDDGGPLRRALHLGPFAFARVALAPSHASSPHKWLPEYGTPFQARSFAPRFAHQRTASLALSAQSVMQLLAQQLVVSLWHHVPRSEAICAVLEGAGKTRGGRAEEPLREVLLGSVAVPLAPLLMHPVGVHGWHVLRTARGEQGGAVCVSVRCTALDGVPRIAGARPLLQDLPHWPTTAAPRLQLHPPPAFADQPARCTVYVDEAVLPEGGRGVGGRVGVRYTLPGSLQTFETCSAVPAAKGGALVAPVRHCGVHWVTADAALHQALLHQPLSLSLYRCPRHGVDREHSGVDRDGGVDHGSGGDVLGTAGLDLAPLLAGAATRSTPWVSSDVPLINPSASHLGHAAVHVKVLLELAPPGTPPEPGSNLWWGLMGGGAPPSVPNDSDGDTAWRLCSELIGDSNSKSSSSAKEGDEEEEATWQHGETFDMLRRAAGGGGIARCPMVNDVPMADSVPSASTAAAGTGSPLLLMASTAATNSAALPDPSAPLPVRGTADTGLPPVQPAIITIEALHLHASTLQACLPTPPTPLGVQVSVFAPPLQAHAVASTAVQRVPTRGGSAQGRVRVDQQHWVDLGARGVLECQVWVCALEVTRVARQHVGTARLAWGDGIPQAVGAHHIRDHGGLPCGTLYAAVLRPSAVAPSPPSPQGSPWGNPHHHTRAHPKAASPRPQSAPFLQQPDGDAARLMEHDSVRDDSRQQRVAALAAEVATLSEDEHLFADSAAAFAPSSSSSSQVGSPATALLAAAAHEPSGPRPQCAGSDDDAPMPGDILVQDMRKVTLQTALPPAHQSPPGGGLAQPVAHQSTRRVTSFTLGFGEDDSEDDGVAPGPSSADVPWLPVRRPGVQVPEAAGSQGSQGAQGRVTSMTLGGLSEELLWGPPGAKGPSSRGGGGPSEEGRLGQDPRGTRSPLGLGRSRLRRRR